MSIVHVTSAGNEILPSFICVLLACTNVVTISFYSETLYKEVDVRDTDSFPPCMYKRVGAT